DCLEYHLGNCKGQCVGEESEEKYSAYITEIEYIIKGDISLVVRLLKERMSTAAEDIQFELSIEVKTKIATIERFQSKSTVVSSTVRKVDVISVLHEEKCAYVNYLVVVNGAIVHGITVEVEKKLEESSADIIGFVLPELRKRYGSKSKEVVVNEFLDLELEGLTFFHPQRGDKRSLVELSVRNTKAFRMDKLKKEKIVDPERHSKRILEQIQKDFRLSELPVHIECFDNSNFHGTNAVAACVVFKQAKPSKKDYRHFNIKT